MGQLGKDKMDIGNVCIHRHEFIKCNVAGLILDVGAREGSMWIATNHSPTYIDPNNITFFDLDAWEITWFPNAKCIRGDANNLEFKDNSFDTVVLGDILEHTETPERVLAEAYRVAKKRVVITIPDEHHWGSGLNPNPEKTEEDYGDMAYKFRQAKDTIGSDRTYAVCKDYIDDGKHKHLYHINRFNDESILKLINSLASKLGESDAFSCHVMRIWFFGDPMKADTLTANYAIVINKNDGASN